MDNKIDTPRPINKKRFAKKYIRPASDGAMADYSGSVSEGIARFLGTPRFLVWLSLFCISWLLWNTLMPEYLRFDSANLGFTALTLILSLQASYAAPLILLAENRQVERDKVLAEQDRQRAERNLSDTEYITREITSVKLALQDTATRDFVRSELRDLLRELKSEEEEQRERAAQVRPRGGVDSADRGTRGERTAQMGPRGKRTAQMEPRGKDGRTDGGVGGGVGAGHAHARTGAGGGGRTSGAGASGGRTGAGGAGHRTDGGGGEGRTHVAKPKNNSASSAQKDKV